MDAVALDLDGVAEIQVTDGNTLTKTLISIATGKGDMGIVPVGAYNLLIAHKLLHLPDDAQGWTLKTLLRQMILLPARLVHHARVAVFKVAVPGEWLAWWRRLHERLWPAPA